MEDAQKIAAIRLRAVKERPYFATALFALTMIRNPGLGTFATDIYGRMYWDPEMVGPGKEWTIVQGAWVLIHELGHWLRKHHERAKPMIENAECSLCVKRDSNVAMDCELNDDLVKEGAQLPDGVITPGKLGMPDGLLWEQYYDLLQKQNKNDGHSVADHPVMVVCGPDCGSAAHGIPGDYELPPPTDGSSQGIRAAEGDLLRKAVAREIQAQASKFPGTVPGGWVRWAEQQLLPAQVPWERELAALVRHAYTTAMGMVDYSYQRPSRRGSFNGVIMPALRRPKPEVSIVVDTSGSMSEPDLHAAICEVQGICKAIGQQSVPVICCDADVHGIQRVSRATDIQLVGGGGTNMGVGIAEAQKLRSHVIVVLTDGWTPWPDEPPKNSELVIGVIRRVGEDEPAVDSEWGIPSYVKRVLRIIPRDEERAA